VGGGRLRHVRGEEAVSFGQDVRVVKTSTTLNQRGKRHPWFGSHNICTAASMIPVQR
jgi:hypothetical protein